MVFVGPNGAGKTNILQALALLLDLIGSFDGSVIERYRYGRTSLPNAGQ